MSSESAPPLAHSAEPDAAELGRCVRDLVACTALPALWSGREAPLIARGLLDVLVSMLRLDVAGIRVLDAAAGIEAWYPVGAPGGALDAAITVLGDADAAIVPASGLGASGSAPVHLVRTPLGVAGTQGVVITGSRRRDYPGPLDALLLRVAVNQAAIALEGARLLAGLRERDRIKDRLVAEAEAARQEAEAANRAKDEFLAILSHELRTPLTAMTGWVRLLRTTDMSAGRTTQALEAIDRSTRQQTRLIEDLLDISRIVAGKFELDRQPVEIDGIVRIAVEAVGTAAAAKGVAVAVTAESGAIVLGDPLRLQQIVGNLLSNAVKFVDDGGHVWVGVSVDPAAGRARVVVHDDGVGIDPQAQAYIFERFRQEDSGSRRRHGGLGLGLAIVHHLVSLHAGTVTVASEGKGRGATFTVELPLVSQQGSEAAGTNAAGTNAAGTLATARLRGLRVLVVDDHADSRELFETILVWAGAQTKTAGSVQEALRIVRETPVDLVVTDLSMPLRDGFDLLDHLRGQLPVVATTAFAGAETRARVLVAGFAGHVTKPVDAAALVETVARVAERTRRPGR